jgi:hypothetical protein
MYHLHLTQGRAENRHSEALYELQTIAEAHTLFERAYSRGRWAKVWSLLTRRSRRLLDLATVQRTRTILGRHYLGVQTVPVRQVRGTENRVRDFDIDFYPLRAGDWERWRGVATVWLMGQGLPPVELIQIGEIYFVLDGHHRLSIARMLGQQEIEAVVTVWDLNKPLEIQPVPAPTLDKLKLILPRFQP